MGVFDFVRDVGAKVGIGKSSEERKAEDQIERSQEMARKIKETAEKNQAAQAAKQATKKVTGEDRAKAREARIERKSQERFAEYNKSIELEKYVSDLGLKFTGLDIRYDDGVAYISGEAPDQETREKIILAVGNAEGVGKVDEEMTVAVAADEAVFHTVVSGDTLWAIADKVYGDGNRYPEIFEANKPMLTDPDLIFPGQVLRCPK